MMTQRMQPNPGEYGYHSREHDEDPTCHTTHEGDTPCQVVETTNDERFVFCVSCRYAVSWLEHTLLQYAIDCPRCGANKQFGPGVYADDFHGYTLFGTDS